MLGSQEGTDEMEDSGMANDWDPMAEDYNSITNNYMTNYDDLEVATHGYRSKDEICPFYVNRGTYYKGAYCEDEQLSTSCPGRGPSPLTRKRSLLGLWTNLTSRTTRQSCSGTLRTACRLSTWVTVGSSTWILPRSWHPV